MWKDYKYKTLVASPSVSSSFEGLCSIEIKLNSLLRDQYSDYFGVFLLRDPFIASCFPAGTSWGPRVEAGGAARGTGQGLFVTAARALREIKCLLARHCTVGLSSGPSFLWFMLTKTYIAGIPLRRSLQLLPEGSVLSSRSRRFKVLQWTDTVLRNDACGPTVFVWV